MGPLQRTEKLAQDSETGAWLSLALKRRNSPFCRCHPGQQHHAVSWDEQCSAMQPSNAAKKEGPEKKWKDATGVWCGNCCCRLDYAPV